MNVAELTFEDYAAARVLAQLELLYPQVKPAPGKRRPSDFVRAYEARRRSPPR